MTRDPDCVFCDIVHGDQSGRIVYENDSTIAFLDINPLAKGHTLVIPREHYPRLSDVPMAVAGQLGRTLVTIVDSVERAVEAQGSTVGFNNGTAAGQVVDHVHAHVIPRFTDDTGGNLHAIIRDTPAISDEELDELAKGIRSAVP